MKKSNFISLLESDGNLGVSQLPPLQSVIGEYPYFQAAQLLLSKAYQDTENLNFEPQLRKAAAYAADRKKLHQLLFHNTHAVPAEVKHQELESSELENQIQAEELVEESVEFISNQSEDPLQNQILSAAINSSILQEVSDEIDLTDFEDLIQKPADSAPKSETQEHFNEDSAHSFADWLKHYSGEPRSVAFGFDIDEKELNTGLSVKQAFYSPAKMAKLSVQEDDDLVTETLASIYADQGNFEKAIKAFEKLQLKYPEKRVYFAGRIKEIQNQLKDQ